MDTIKQDHLIERAAARLRSPIIRPESPPGPIADEKPVLQGLTSRTKTRTQQSDLSARPPIALEKLAEAHLIDWGDAYSRAAEEFRIIKNRILRQIDEMNSAGARNLVMVTSARKGEGKSFTAINLAGELARQHDRRVLLVDADPKAGGLRQQLGVSDARGLLDLVRSETPRPNLTDLILPTEVAFLDFLPLGADARASGELFASKAMTECLIELGRRNPDRLIMFDAPPCLASSIPHTLAASVGQIVLIVAAGSTQQADIEAALELVQICPQTSLLLNKIPAWSTHSFGSYGYLAAA